MRETNSETSEARLSDSRIPTSSSKNTNTVIIQKAELLWERGLRNKNQGSHAMGILSASCLCFLVHFAFLSPESLPSLPEMILQFPGSSSTVQKFLVLAPKTNPRKKFVSFDLASRVHAQNHHYDQEDKAMQKKKDDNI